MNKRHGCKMGLVIRDLYLLRAGCDAAIKNHGDHIEKLYKLAKRNKRAGMMLCLSGILTTLTIWELSKELEASNKRIEALTKELDNLKLQGEYTTFKDEGDI